MKRNIIIKSFLYLVFNYFVLFNSSLAFSQVKVLKFCVDEVDNWPWVIADTKGLYQEYINYFEKNLHVKVKLERRPWLRCFNEIRSGKYDAILDLSFREERLSFGGYPTTMDGEIDTERRTHDSAYFLYVLKNNKDIKWDGKSLTGVLKPIMTTLGYSIRKKLNEELKVKVIEKNVDTSTQFKELLSGNVDGVANLDFASDHILKSKKEFEDKIVKFFPPLESKAYYIMLSHQLLKSSPKLAQSIWDGVKIVRESKEFKLKLENELKRQK